MLKCTYKHKGLNFNIAKFLLEIDMMIRQLALVIAVAVFINAVSTATSSGYNAMSSYDH